jgi:nitroimidazol reductase NimA-like FMN-containing flavoprotein (pyridoxamine 5'-phosphate oxidase superfamily)
VWVDGVFYFGSGPQTRKVRNLAENPSVAVHPAGDDVVIVEGVAEALTDPDPALAERVSAGPRPGWDCGELENPVPLG